MEWSFYDSFIMEYLVSVFQSRFSDSRSCEAMGAALGASRGDFGIYLYGGASVHLLLYICYVAMGNDIFQYAQALRCMHPLGLRSNVIF